MSNSVQVIDPWVIARKLASTLLPPATAERLYGYIRNRDLSRLCGVGEVQDIEYLSPEITELLALRQVAALFKKNASFADENRCREAARSSFEAGERQCRITNKRLDHYGLNPTRMPGDIAKWMGRMEQDIAHLVGTVTDLIEVLPRKISLTSGATEDRSRKRSYPFLKITGKIRAPRAAVTLIGSILKELGVDLAPLKFAAVEMNAVDFVPKNWKTHRMIAKEPTHALPLQLAVDSFLKRLLRKWGIDLSSQERNQDLARQGSIDGSWATIDLKGASDTVAISLAAWLLPWDWYDFIVSIRSTLYRAPWQSAPQRYAKLSSMGNGYTFALETLFFTAACRAVGSRDHAVYGDDIVIRTEFVSDLLRLLKFMGFTVNEEKSFVNPNSRFRESCGGDYYQGRRVTPFYLRDAVRVANKAEVAHMVNGLVAVSWDGALWDYLRKIVTDNKLRLVPWNDDSRSGVWISPHTAWKTHRLRIDQRLTITRKVYVNGVRTIETVPNPTYGQPVYRGYGMMQRVRSTRGWRSYLLWFARAKGENASRPEPKRTSAFLLSKGASVLDDYGLPSNSVSAVAVDTRYKHDDSKRFYPPICGITPGILFPWEECLGLDPVD